MVAAWCFRGRQGRAALRKNTGADRLFWGVISHPETKAQLIIGDI